MTDVESAPLNVGLVLTPSDLKNNRITIGHLISTPLLYYRHPSPTPPSSPIQIYIVRVIQSMDFGKDFRPGILYTPNTDQSRDIAVQLLFGIKDKCKPTWYRTREAENPEVSLGKDCMISIWEKEVAKLSAMMQDLSSIPGWRAEIFEGSSVFVVGESILEVSKGGERMLAMPGVRWEEGVWSDQLGMDGLIIASSPSERFLHGYREQIEEARIRATYDVQVLYNPEKLRFAMNAPADMGTHALKLDGWSVVHKPVEDVQYIHEPDVPYLE